MPDRCILCGDIIPEGRQVCYTCEMRELSAFDSSLQTGDIMRELNCDRRDAELIMDTFGGMQGHRRTVAKDHAPASIKRRYRRIVVGQRRKTPRNRRDNVP